MATTFDVLIDIQARVQAIQDATNGIKNLNKEAAGFGQAFKLGEMIDLAGRLNSAIRELPALFGEAVKQGIEFNSLIEQSRIGVAGMLRQFGGDTYKDFNLSLKESDRLISLLRGKANDLGLSFDAMLEQYRTTAGALFAGGVRDLQKQVDLTVLLTQAMGSLGITGFRAQKDIIDLLEGRAAQTIAGRALGVSDLDVKNASQAGELYSFLTEKFRALGDAGKVLGTTLAASEQRSRNFGEILKGIATQDVFNDLKDSLNQLNAVLADPRTAEAARGVGGVFHSIVIELEKAIDRGREFGRIFAQIPGTLPGFLKAFGSQTFSDNQTQQFADAEGRNLAVIHEQIVSAQTLEDRKRAFLALSEQINQVEGRTHDENQDIAAAAQVVLEHLREWLSTFDKIVGSAQQAKVAIADTAKATQAIAEVEAKIALLKAEASGDEETIAADRAKVAYEQILQSLRDKEVPEAKAKELADQYAEATRSAALAKTEQKDAQHDFNAELRVESDLLKDIRVQERLISESPFLSADQKQGALTDLFKNEQAQLLEAMQRLETLQKQPDVYGDPSRIEAVKEKLRELGAEYVELEFKLQTSSFGGQIGEELNNWLNSFGTTAHQVASIITGTLNTAIQGTSSAITGLIFGTQNWRQAFASVAQSVVQNLIQIGLQILLQQTIGAVIRRAFAAAELKAIQAEGQAAHAAWAPAAIAASIASDGAAAGFGLTAYLGAEAAGTAISFIPGFHTGGVVGDGETPAFHAGGLSRQERLVRALVGEGFFLPEQMENLFVRPGAEHLFQDDQLEAIGGKVGDRTSRASRLPAGFDPGEIGIEPDPLPGTGTPFIPRPGHGGGVTITPGDDAVPPSQVPQTPGPGTYPDDPTFIDSPSGPIDREGGDVPLYFIGRDGEPHLIPNPNNVSITDIGAGHDFGHGTPVHQDSSGNVVGYLDSPISHTGFQSGSHEGVDITQNLIQSTILAHHQLHTGGIVPIDAHEGEGVLNVGAMHAIGADTFHALNGLRHEVARPSFDAGGIIGGDAAAPDGSGRLSLGASDIGIYNYVDRDKLYADLKNSRHARNFVIDVLSDSA